MATTIIPKPKQLWLVRLRNRIAAVDAVALANAVTAHLVEHRTRLRTEAQLILSSEEL